MSYVTALTELLKALAGFAWPAAFFGFVWWFNKPILNILAALRDQIDRGASLKYGELELQGIKLANFPLVASAVYERIAADDEILRARDTLYGSQKNIFLVHRVLKTQDLHAENGMPVYDISVYLVTHKTFGALNDVKSVEYYFGKFSAEIYLQAGRNIWSRTQRTVSQ
ncbi:hypothetical protein [Rhizobium leguminosarum]|uniref:hypothetical protein n=1 Tax=Rhizobium leguminosarum TaxID=384 RepID=UPI003F97CFC1